ncbi:MAG: HAD hydrolase-like protein [Alphaproteobacteria bacterium]|nr:HAD hydrolase-like protein [Alphaproteobacteria bacterium]
MNRYDWVILDFDGTLADSAPWFKGVVNTLAERFSFSKVDEDEYERLRGEDSLTILRAVGVPIWKIPRISRYVHRLVAKQADQILLFDGVDALLRNLSERGVTIAMVSSNTKANVKRILGDENSARFTYFGCGASVFGKATKFRRALRALKADPARTIAIGDEERDISAAREAGIAAGSVSWGYATPSILKAGAPDHFFETIGEIAELVAPAEANEVGEGEE